jgi:hypothetical protein
LKHQRTAYKEKIEYTEVHFKVSFSFYIFFFSAPVREEKNIKRKSSGPQGEKQ